MAVKVLTNASIYIGEFDISTKLNNIAVAMEAEVHDISVFKDTARKKIGGIINVRAAFSGLWEGGTDNIDEIMYNKIAVSDVLFSFSDTGNDGDTGYFMKATQANYRQGGTFGEVHDFEGDAEAQTALIKGTIMAKLTGATASGNGTARQLGAVTAAQKLYAGLHVLKADGTSPTLDVIVQSDDNSGMTSPTNRITFTRATAKTHEWATPVNGAITDDWWRINYTIGGTSPDFDFVVVVGIQS